MFDLYDYLVGMQGSHKKFPTASFSRILQMDSKRAFICIDFRNSVHKLSVPNAYLPPYIIILSGENYTENKI